MEWNEDMEQCMDTPQFIITSTVLFIEIFKEFIESIFSN